MNNDRIVCRPAFDLENFGDGLFVQCVGGQAIDRLRRQRHDFARAQQFRRLFYSGIKKRRRVCGQNFSGHTLFIAQRLDGVELRSFARGIKAEENPHCRAENKGDQNGLG